jgi:hypothetical protein
MMDAWQRAVVWVKDDPFAAEFAEIARTPTQLTAEGVAIGQRRCNALASAPERTFGCKGSVRAANRGTRCRPTCFERGQPSGARPFLRGGRPIAGFRQAGFDIRLGVDADDDACTTYRLNQRGARAFIADLRQVSGRDLLAEAGIGEVAIVLGGPSCQGFSTHGRRNGWVRPDDSRNFLYREYARVIDELQPHCFVMENVPGPALLRQRQVLGADPPPLYSSGIPSPLRTPTCRRLRHPAASPPTTSRWYPTSRTIRLP